MANDWNNRNVGTSPEVEAMLADEQFSMEDMEKMYAETLQNFTEGEVVRGTVVEITTDRVLVDIGYKSEGVVPMEEFPDQNSVQVGDQFDVYIEQPEAEDGMPVLSKLKADRIKNWTHIQRVYEEDGVIEGKIVRRVKGGLGNCRVVCARPHLQSEVAAAGVRL